MTIDYHDLGTIQPTLKKMYGKGKGGSMPVTIKKRKRKGKRATYTTSTPGGVKGRGMTLRNAIRQANLLRAVEHGWRPTGKPARR